MVGFDSSTFFSTINTSITNTGNNALSQVRSIGAQPSIALNSAVTTAKNLPDPKGKKIVWDNSNIIESYPGLTSPLTFSFIVKIPYKP